MFYSLTGELVYTDAGNAAVRCTNGVAYLCRVSRTTLNKLGQEGNEVTLYTFLSVRQDGIDLYGFYDRKEKELFQMLTGVSGVGPKAALSILSVLDPSQLALALASGDYKTLTQAQGVGPKVAQRIVLELKDKMAKSMENGSLPKSGAAAAASPSGAATSVSDAINALVMLGYSQAEAAHSVAGLDPALPTETLLKQALKRLAG